jgi:carboxylesterase
VVADAIYLQDYIHKGNNGKVVLFVHGIFSSPQQFKAFYQPLCKLDYSVYAILLKGHGKDLKTLSKTKYYEWINQIENLLIDFKKNYQEVFIIGHSMGGLLALGDYDALVSKRIVIAPSICIKVTWRYFKLGLLVDKKNVKDKYVSQYQSVLGITFPSSIFKKILVLPCFWQLFKVISYAKKNLIKISKPILTIQSKNDECIRRKGPKKIINNVNSHQKEILWLNKSFHAVFDTEEEIFMISKVIEFIESN